MALSDGLDKASRAGVDQATAVLASAALTTQPHLRALNPHVEAMVSAARRERMAEGGEAGMCGRAQVSGLAAARLGSACGGEGEASGELAGVSSFAYMGTNAHAILGGATSSECSTPGVRAWEARRAWCSAAAHALAQRGTTRAAAGGGSAVSEVECALETRPALAYLRDHAVAGRALVPGTGSAELLWAAAGALRSGAEVAGRGAAQGLASSRGGGGALGLGGASAALVRVMLARPLLLREEGARGASPGGGWGRSHVRASAGAGGAVAVARESAAAAYVTGTYARTAGEGLWMLGASRGSHRLGADRKGSGCEAGTGKGAAGGAAGQLRGHGRELEAYSTPPDQLDSALRCGLALEPRSVGGVCVALESFASISGGEEGSSVSALVCALDRDHSVRGCGGAAVVRGAEVRARHGDEAKSAGRADGAWSQYSMEAQERAARVWGARGDGVAVAPARARRCAVYGAPGLAAGEAAVRLVQALSAQPAPSRAGGGVSVCEVVELQLPRSSGGAASVARSVARSVTGESLGVQLRSIAACAVDARARSGRAGGEVAEVLRASAGAMCGSAERRRGGAAATVTGGLGALGSLTAIWLLQEARCSSSVLMGRSGRGSAGGLPAARGGVWASVLAVRCDTASRSEWGVVVSSPAGTVAHSGGCLADSLAQSQTARRFDAVLAPKVAALSEIGEARAGGELAMVFSSIAVPLASAGQANYVAANASLDLWVELCGPRGSRAASSQWGAWGGREGRAAAARSPAPKGAASG